MPESIYTPDLIFPVIVRRPYTAPGGPIDAFFQDAHYVDLILRYTTNDVTNPNYPFGKMSVYRPSGANILVEAEKGIRHDSYGNPVEYVDVQRYFPSPVYCPRYIEIGRSYWNSTPGQYGYCLGACNPANPDPGTDIRHDVAVYCDGHVLWLDEDYFDHGALKSSKGFRIDVATKQLLSWRDKILNVDYFPVMLT